LPFGAAVDFVIEFNRNNRFISVFAAEYKVKIKLAERLKSTIEYIFKHRILPVNCG